MFFPTKICLFYKIIYFAIPLLIIFYLSSIYRKAQIKTIEDYQLLQKIAKIIANINPFWFMLLIVIHTNQDN